MSKVRGSSDEWFEILRLFGILKKYWLFFQMANFNTKSKRAKKDSTILVEHVNVDLLRSVATSPLGSWVPQPGGPSFRTILSDIIACCSGGCLKSAWVEEDLATSHGVLGRRYSGKRGAQGEYFQRLLDQGITPCVVGASFFAFPVYLRDLARAGIPNVWVVDMVNAYPTIDSKRRPTVKAVEQYVDRRDEKLELVQHYGHLARVEMLRAEAKSLLF